MKLHHVVVAIAVALSFSFDAGADTSQLRVRALRQARKIARTTPQPEVSAAKNTNFDGVWGGRYVYSSGSSCAQRLSSFNFRHVLVTRGGSGYLSTSHDRDFTGRSRDKGRRWEFVKRFSSGSASGVVAVVYHSLSRNGNSAGSGYVISFNGRCELVYVGNSIRLAR
jgi:hypothetical protein